MESQLFEEAGRSHARLLLPMMDGVLAEAGRGREEMRAVVVGCGPGTFTGVRLGVATARAIAVGLNVPVLGVSTLGALAAAATDQGSWNTQNGRSIREMQVLTVAVDGRRDELFAAVYRRSGSEPSGGARTPWSSEAAEKWRKVGETFACPPWELREGVEQRVPEPGKCAAICPPGFVEGLVESGGFSLVAGEDPSAAHLLCGQERLVEPDGVSGGWTLGEELSHHVMGAVGDERQEAEGAFPPWGAPESVSPIYVRPPDADAHIKKMRYPWRS